ncbi:MAG: ATP-binding protein [Candidatus Aenigmarchaeota archaeon]|nr:ATP-binding protein [Candidatus Aenigmarchaeota archaeon]
MKKVPNWYVITGGPNSGKTTTIDCLKDMGYHVVPEYTRMMIDKEMARGKTIQEIRGDPKVFQERALKLKLLLEKNAPRNKLIFLDRGLPDTIAYHRFLKLDMPKRLFKMSKNRYKMVFILDLLPYKNDYARTENGQEAKGIHRQIKKIYRELGYKIVRVPVMPVENRVKLILKNLK